MQKFLGNKDNKIFVINLLLKMICQNILWKVWSCCLWQKKNGLYFRICNLAALLISPPWRLKRSMWTKCLLRREYCLIFHLFIPALLLEVLCQQTGDYTCWLILLGSTMYWTDTLHGVFLLAVNLPVVIRAERPGSARLVLHMVRLLVLTAVLAGPSIALSWLRGRMNFCTGFTCLADGLMPYYLNRNSVTCFVNSN